MSNMKSKMTIRGLGSGYVLTIHKYINPSPHARPDMQKFPEDR